MNAELKFETICSNVGQQQSCHLRNWPKKFHRMGIPIIMPYCGNMSNKIKEN